MNLTKPADGNTSWGSPVNQNWTDIENALTNGAGMTLAASTPSQITANQNDYGFTGGTSSYVFQRISSDAARTITGFSGGSDGRLLALRNVGSFDISIAHQSASSTAANRVITRSGGTLVVAAGTAVILLYDATTQRWQETGGPASTELQWEFSGTISTDQNPNMGRYRAKTPITLRHFDVNFVSAGEGGDTVVIFRVNGATVATVTVPEDERDESVDVTVTLAVNDELWPEVSSVASTVPPTTGVFSARS